MAQRHQRMAQPRRAGAGPSRALRCWRRRCRSRQPMTAPDAPALDSGLLAEIDGMLDLRTPNRDAVETLAYELWRHYQQDGHQHPFEGVIDSATGVGKTFVIVAAVEYLARAQGVRDFVVGAPSRVVLDKTIEQFTRGSRRSIVDRLSVPIELITAENFNTPA